MKKIAAVFCSFMLFFLMGNVVYAADSEGGEKDEAYQNGSQAINEIDEYDMDCIMETLTNTKWEKNGQSIVVNNRYKITYEEKEIQESNRVYSDTKTSIASLKVSDLNGIGNQTAFVFSQTVTYVINDITQVVTITAYDATYTQYNNSYSCSVYHDTVIGNANTTTAVAHKEFIISKNSHTWLVGCWVNVFITGQTDFDFILM